jgi:hypothetical protein
MVCSRARGGKTALLGWKSSVPRRIVLGIDANVLIYALEGNPEFGPDAKHVLRDSVENTGCSASELIIMELMARKMNETTAARLYTSKKVCKVGLRITGGNQSFGYSKKYKKDSFDLLFVFTEKGEIYLIPWQQIIFRNELSIESKKYRIYRH